MHEKQKAKNEKRIKITPMTLVKTFSLKGEKGRRIDEFLKTLPNASDFIVDAIMEKIDREVKRIKSEIASWKEKIAEEKRLLSKTDDPKKKAHLQYWIEEYNRYISNCQRKLRIYSIKEGIMREKNDSY